LLVRAQKQVGTVTVALENKEGCKRFLMAKIINLRRFSKQKQREEQARQAAENAVKFGRTKAERALTEKQNAASEARLDGHKREDP
jgi:hypothetical protein